MFGNPLCPRPEQRLSPLHFRDETEALSSYQKYGEETRPDKMNDEQIKVIADMLKGAAIAQLVGFG